MSSNTDFFNALSVVYRHLTNHSNKILEKYHISLSYWRVMRILDREGAKNFGEITTILQIEKPALTKIIKKLIEMNIVEIRRGMDKREKIISITNKGEQLLINIRQELDPILNKALENIPVEQTDMAKDLLLVIQKNFNKA